MKHPIDSVTVESYLGHLTAHDRAQRQIIQALSQLLGAAMSEMGSEDTDWYSEATKVLKHQAEVKACHDTRLFNEKNGHGSAISQVSPEIIQTDYSGIKLGPQQIVDPEVNQRLSEQEAGFGGELSEDEMEKFFGPRPKVKKAGVDLSQKDPFKDMTLEEIEAWEASQNNANDIYKIKARIGNLAVGISGGNLTPVGTMMVNSFVHVVKDLYDFADTLTDKQLRIKLTERIKKHESMPGTLIAAASAGVKVKR